MLLKWITAIKAIIAAINELLDGLGTPPGAASATSQARSQLAEAEDQLAAIESECSATMPEGAQAALGDRLKNLFALLMKILGGLGGLLG